MDTTARIDYQSLQPSQLMAAVTQTKELRERDQLISAILNKTLAAKTATEKAKLWPSAEMLEREKDSGLYPDPADPMFAARLYQKREFYEARAIAASVANGTVDACASASAEKLFELTPIQRIVARFMNPLTPYKGLLLFHGVGVGKTCSAVTIAEQFLEVNPSNKVIVLVPQALQDNFKNTIFDTNLTPSAQKLVWNSEGYWTAPRQCTGTSYLDRLNLTENPDPREVVYKIKEDIRKRYVVTGYQAFANYIRDTFNSNIPEGLTDAVARRTIENELLRKLFTDHLIIVDEAHNLRDLVEDTQGPITTTVDTVTGATTEIAENKAGKALNPYLKRIVLNAEGLRMVLMTATPMYNSSPEILLLLNYLLMNDSKSERTAMKIDEIFTQDGEIRDDKAQQRLERAARAYVSYMRGENPYTFPLRMKPREVENIIGRWPSIAATSNPMRFTDSEAAAIDSLPIQFTVPIAESPVDRLLRDSTKRGHRTTAPVTDEDVEGQMLLGDAPLSDTMLDGRMQMANLTYPNQMYGIEGFDFHFSRTVGRGAGHNLHLFSPKPSFNIDSVFAGDALRAHAPKIHTIVEKVRKSKGICFIYSRYIKAGAIPLAIALERIGFQRKLADGSIAPLLKGVSHVPPICAICSEPQHADTETHSFTPACYVLLTSVGEISPGFSGLVGQAASWPSDNPNGPRGSNVRVVIGSQVASEGLDLKCIREVHILDSWYHLNRADQIIGRAIRYCSHSALPVEERNCTIYLHATLLEENALGPAMETADMYAYRLAIGKAQKIGKVQRLLKRHAWDCNLELEAITFAGLPTRRQIDSQGNVRETYDINDQDFTTYCDYQTCNHQCAITIAQSDIQLDNSTFSVSDARRLILAKHDVVRRLFDTQIMIPETIVQQIFADLPEEIVSESLMELLDGQRFKLTRPDGVFGFLVKKAGYLVFQPAAIHDTEIPITMRYAKSFQMLRHTMVPQYPVFQHLQPARAPPRIPLPTPVKPTTVKTAAPTAGPTVGPTPPTAGPTVGPTPGPTPTAGPAATAGPGPTELTAIDPIDESLLDKWDQWVIYVKNESERTRRPDGLQLSAELWQWILINFKSIPNITQIAYQWWFDKNMPYVEQRQLLEYAITNPTERPELQELLKPNIYINKSITAYQVFNPALQVVEYYSFNTKFGGFKLVSSVMADVLRKELTPTPVKIPEAIGALIGFLSTSKGKTVFKTLDINKKSTGQAPGAECDSSSNLEVHHAKVLTLYSKIQTSDPELAALLPSATPIDPSLKKRTFTDITSFYMLTHLSLCLYLELLTRIMDARALDGKRWFLNAVNASVAGLKGR